MTLRTMGFAILAGVAGCRSPDPLNYTLLPVAGTIVPAARSVIEVQHPGLAGYLDRDSIVTKSDGYLVAVDHGARWAEPLGDMIGRVLAQNLAQRLPGSTVFAEGGALTVDADLRVALDVRRFDTAGDGKMRLAGEVALERGHVPLRTHHLDLEILLRGSDAAALAGTMSNLLGQVADQVAQDAALAGR